MSVLREFLVRALTSDGESTYSSSAPDALTVRRRASQFYGERLRRVFVYERKGGRLEAIHWKNEGGLT